MSPSTFITAKLDTAFSRVTNFRWSQSWAVSAVLAAAVVIETLLILRFHWLLSGYNPNSSLVGSLMTTSSYLMRPFAFIARGSLVDVPYIEWSIPVAMEVYAIVAWTSVQALKLREKRAAEPAKVFGEAEQRTLVSFP